MFFFITVFFVGTKYKNYIIKKGLELQKEKLSLFKLKPISIWKYAYID
tara:strand:+ start:2814 stop:2957 length:144 start_codon:yes stop_codon:yes gene_type:complete